MGDRAAFGFKADNESQPIWLYSHWGGSTRYEDLAKAIDESQPRWGDPAYATRIAVSRLIGEAWKQEYSYGLSAGADGFCGIDYDDVPVVIWSDLVIEVYRTDGNTISGAPIARMSFNEILQSRGYEPV